MICRSSLYEIEGGLSHDNKLEATSPQSKEEEEEEENIHDLETLENSLPHSDIPEVVVEGTTSAQRGID